MAKKMTKTEKTRREAEVQKLFDEANTSMAKAFIENDRLELEWDGKEATNEAIAELLYNRTEGGCADEGFTPDILKKALVQLGFTEDYVPGGGDDDETDDDEE